MKRLLLLPVLLLSLPGCRDTGANGVRPAADAELPAALTADAVVVTLGTSIRFDAGDSTDAAGIAARFSDTTLDEFSWDFGDGDAVTTDFFYVDHIYEDAGTFTATVTVNQGDATDSATLDVEVRFPPPTLLGPDAGADAAAHAPGRCGRPARSAALRHILRGGGVAGRRAAVRHPHRTARFFP